MLAQLHTMSGEELLLLRVLGTPETVRQIEQELQHRFYFGPSQCRSHCGGPFARMARQLVA